MHHGNHGGRTGGRRSNQQPPPPEQLGTLFADNQSNNHGHVPHNPNRQHQPVPGGGRGGAHHRNHVGAAGGPPTVHSNAHRCNHPETCFNEACGFVHSVGACPNWSNCMDYFCQLRHGKQRKMRCKFEGSCRNKDSTCTFLHPPNATAVSTPAVCKHPSTCFNEACNLNHSVEACQNWSSCVNYFCELRHGKQRKGRCKSESLCHNQNTTCTFLHPPVSIAPLCNFDANCTSQGCKRRHSVGVCQFWSDCQNYDCFLRHGSDRPKRCKHGKNCAVTDCRKGLHPPECPDPNCLRILCSARHRHSSLQEMIFVNAERLVARGTIAQPLLEDIRNIRNAHNDKLKALRGRHIKAVQSISAGDDEETNLKLRDALVKEGYELQYQLDYFDEIVHSSIQDLQKAARSTGTGVATFKQQTIFKIEREIFRLKLALPALSKRKDVEQKIETSQFLVVKGETGSGKSTQLPQYMVEFLNSKKKFGKKVICTQPRKVSATSLAERVAFEWSADKNSAAKSNSVGGVVGYRVGAQRKTSHATRIEYCTEDLFLKNLLSIYADGRDEAKDPLRDVGVIIIDEAHERSISCDIILASLQKLAPERWPDIKVIITSATINTELFCKYFRNCPLVEIPGRMFPVDVQYHPIANSNFGIDSDSSVYVQASVDMAMTLHSNLKVSDGDILCFLTGQDEVEKAKTMLEGKFKKFPKSQSGCAAEVLMLYGKQPPDEQRAVFEKLPANKRKIIFSTNVAETGVTIDGVRHVIDTGLTKESRYDPKRNITVLQVDSICQSSATQRKGRAGRTSPGTCYRLYKEEDFLSMDLTQTPEVLSRPLSLTLVNLISMGIRNPREFNWMESPSNDAFESALYDLTMLECITKTAGANDYRLTDFGRVVVALQIDPNMAKLIYVASLQGKGRHGCLLAGILSVASMFYFRAGTQESKQVADAKHLAFASDKGDLLSMFQVYRAWKEVLLRSEQQASSASANAAQDSDDDDDLASLVDDTTIDSRTNNEEQSILLKGDEEGGIDFDEMSSLDDAASVASAISDVSFGAKSVVSNTSEASDISIISDASVQAELRQMQEEEAMVKRYAKNKPSREWCKEHSISSKSLQMALNIANDLILELNRLPEKSFWKNVNQSGVLTDEDIPLFFFQAYFTNIALQIKNNGIFSVLRHGTDTAYIHPGSSILKLWHRAKINNPLAAQPSYVVYHSILSTSRTFMQCVTTVEPRWLSSLPAQFRSTFDEKAKGIPNTLVQKTLLSTTLAAKLIGKGGAAKRAFETQHNCSMHYDEQTLTLDIWCTETKKNEIERSIDAQLVILRQHALSEREEAFIFGNVRAIHSAGYAVQRLLFKNEVTALHISGMPVSKTEEEIKAYVIQKVRQSGKPPIEIMNVEILHANDEEGSVVLIQLNDPKDADIIMKKIDNDIWESHQMTVSISGVKSNAQPSSSTSQLLMSWPVSPSAGEAIIEFASARAANMILSRASQFSATFHALLGNCAIAPVGATAMNAKLPRVEKHLFVESPQNNHKAFPVKMTCLHSEADEYTIRESLEAFYRDVYNVRDNSLLAKNIGVKRQEVTQSNSAMMLQLNTLHQMIPLQQELLCDPLSFFDSKYPGRAGLYLRYKTAESTQRAYQTWLQRTEPAQFNGQAIRMEAQYTTTISIHESLWKDMNRLIGETAQEFMNQHPNLHIIEKEVKRDLKVPRRSLRIQSNQLTLTESISEKMQALIRPEVYNPPSDEMRKMMFSHAAIGLLKRVSDNQTYVHWDKQRQMIFIYGAKEEARRRGMEAITAGLNNLISQYNKFQVIFRNQKSASEFSKAWKAKSKDKLFADEIASVKVMRGKVQCKVECFSTTAAQAAFIQWIQGKGYVANDGAANGAHPVAALTPSDCSICLCEMDEDAFFLGACEHGGCRSCFEGQFHSANNREYVETPVHCALCGPTTCMTLYDIRSLASATGIENIKRCAVTKYMRENPNIAVCCPNVGKCENLLDGRLIRRVGDEDTRGQETQGGTAISYCDSCDVAYCLTCSETLGKAVKEHKGDTCADHLASGGGKRQYVNMLLEECNLRCPHCKIAFYDFTNCCAVTCHCNKHFCALCLIPCTDSSAAHSHVKSCELNVQKGGYYNSPTEISAAQRLVRIRALKKAAQKIPADVKKDVLDLVEKHLLDYNIYVFDISGK